MFRASEIRRMILSEANGRVPTMRELRKTQAYAHISEACGVDVWGRPLTEIREGKEVNVTPQMGLGKGGNDVSIRDLFEQLCIYSHNGEPVGHGFVQETMFPGAQEPLWEEGGAMAGVNSTLFMGITGQLLFTKMLPRYNAEEFIVKEDDPDLRVAVRAGEVAGRDPAA